MRPTANPQSALRTPLNAILGTEVNVRLLRVLAGSSAALTPAELAKRTRLDPSGIRRALATLEETGIIEFLGIGSRRPARLCPAHPLGEALQRLFGDEQARVARLLDGLRVALHDIEPPLIAAWVQGRVALSLDGPDDPVVVSLLLSSTNDRQRVRESLESALEDLERSLDVMVELRACSRDDLANVDDVERQELRDALPLIGSPPADFVDGAPATNGGGNHAGGVVTDDTAHRVTATALADALRDDPSVVRRIREWVTERLDRAQPGELRELREWDRILRTMSPARLRRFLADPGARATRLRRMLPFDEALSLERFDHHGDSRLTRATAEASEAAS